jgi:hypothetical protein
MTGWTMGLDKTGPNALMFCNKNWSSFLKFSHAFKYCNLMLWPYEIEILWPFNFDSLVWTFHEMWTILLQILLACQMKLNSVFWVFCGIFINSVKHFLSSYAFPPQFELRAKVVGQTIMCVYLFCYWAFGYLFLHHFLVWFVCQMNVMSIEVATLAFQLGASLFSLWPFVDWSFHS